MTSLSDRLLALAAGHKTDLLKVQKNYALSFDSWLQAAKALKLGPANARTREQAGRASKSADGLPAFPDALEVCYDVNGHGGFKARAKHDGHIFYLEGDSPKRPWSKTGPFQWPPRAVTEDREWREESGVLEERSRLLGLMTRILRKALQMPLPSGSEKAVNYHSPIPAPRVTNKKGPGVILNPDYSRYWEEEGMWDAQNNKVLPEAFKRWEESVGPLRHAWDEMVDRLRDSLHGVWKVESEPHEVRGRDQNSFQWAPRLSLFLDPLAAQGDLEDVAASIRMLEKELPSIVQHYQQVASSTRSDDLDMDTAQHDFVQGVVRAAMKSGPRPTGTSFLSFYNTETRGSTLHVELRFNETEVQELDEPYAQKINDGWVYLEKGDINDWLNEWETGWEYVVPSGWDVPSMDFPNKSAGWGDVTLTIVIPHEAEMPLSLAKKIGKTAGQQFKELLSMLFSSGDAYAKHKNMSYDQVSYDPDSENEE